MTENQKNAEILTTLLSIARVHEGNRDPELNTLFDRAEVVYQQLNQDVVESDTIEVAQTLATLVRLHEGNKHDDINQLLSNASAMCKRLTSTEV